MGDYNTIAKTAKTQRKIDDRKERANNGYQSLNFILGLTAVVTGSIHLNSAEVDCPWSPQLPTYLLVYGIALLGTPMATLSLCCCCCCLTGVKSCGWTCLGMTAVIINIGFTAWGFALLYSNPSEVTYSTGDNYCTQAVYFVSMTVTWLSAVVLILLIIGICCLSGVACCLVCFLKKNRATEDV